MSAARRNLVLGLAGIVLTVGFVFYVLSGLGGHPGGPFQVKVTFARTGQLLRVSGDVKLRGVQIGQIAKIQHEPNATAIVTLAIDPGMQIPEDVTAMVGAKTLFGEKFVALVDPAHPNGRLLRNGDQIPENRTTPPFELDQVIAALVPILDSAKPGDLGGALHALAVGLAGQEQGARDAMDKGVTALAVLAAHKGDLDRVLAGMDASTGALSKASPDLVASLNSLDKLSKQLVTDSTDVQAFLRDAPTVLNKLADLVDNHYQDLVDISVKGADILDIVAAHRSALPSTVAALKTFTQDWDTNLSIPCTNSAGQTVGQLHPSLEGSTCWQLWVLSAEQTKNPGGYTGNGPTPAPATASSADPRILAAYRAQVGQLLALPFGTQPSDVALLMNGALVDGRGLIPERLL
ncbi:MAG: MCE family protein [Actinobacteria bacterium]|nr:MAG: MCE family protein [Actinomycetota bacterium]